MLALTISYLESVGARCPALSILLCLLLGYGLGMEWGIVGPLGLMLALSILGACLILLSQRCGFVLSSRMFYLGVCAMLIGTFAYRSGFEGCHPPKEVELWTKKGRSRLVASMEAEGLGHDISLLSAAMAIGYKGDGDELKELKVGFAHAGVAHIMVLSGLHVSLVGWLILMMLYRIPYLRDLAWVQGLLSVLAIWGFVVFVGLGAPAVRAALMLSLVWVGRLRMRPTHYINLLCASATIQLLLEPSLFYSWSFRLSYVAVTSIYLYYPIFLSILSRLRHPLLKYCFEALALTCSAQVLVLPMCFYLFGEISWAWIFSSVPVGVLSLVFISLSLFSYLSLAILGCSFDWLLFLIDWIGRSLLGIVDWASHLPYLHQGGGISIGGLLLYYIVVLGGALCAKAYRYDKVGAYPFREVVFHL